MNEFLWIVGSLIVGCVCGYAFRGWIHGKVSKL